MSEISNVAVLGAGSWGTAIALQLARLNHHVNLWGRDASQINAMLNDSENKRYLPGIKFSENIKPCTDFVTALNQVHSIVVAVPSDAFRETLEKIKPHFSSNQPVIWLTKGVDPQTHHLLHEVAQEILGKDATFAVLSGPSFATEVAMQLPTAVVLASNNNSAREALVNLFHSRNFRVYFSSDLVGVQLGGAVKNVMAIAVGIADGLQCGANAQAALMTRGLAELMRLGQAMGANAETLMGLSGIGDMILTCTNNQSRNRRFGLAIGKGETREKAEQAIAQVIEGIKAAAEIHVLAQRFQVDMPITEHVYQVLYQQLSPQAALNNLLMREPKMEH